ncbi:MAG: EAL domain-containing protein, partial [Proteobacteria bacterium]|nr:EAL domain-containing protein [Pseudomonadota bacterium]
AQQVAEKLVNLIGEEIFSAGDSSVNCTVSIAVTQLTPESKSVNEIMRILSNQAKKLVDAGGNSINVFDPAEEEKLARAASKVWIDKITDGLQNDQFCLHYQSIVNINGDEKDHYEVLVRLNSDMDLIYPKQFIPIAMRHGFIQDIDQWVIKKVIKVALEQQKNIMFYIKLSPSTLTNPSFPSWLSDQLRKAGLSGEKFAFEIKESELITHAKKMKPIIKSIKGLNCSIVVEKFGSGLNSFTILKHFPVDLLKIDSSFMEDLATDEETQAKVREIIEKAHAQGKLVICEFVEDANTMSTLWKLSVNFVQGNFIAPPSEKMAHIE